MSDRNIFGDVLYRISALLSQRVSESDKFFKETALMEIKLRKAYAMLYAIEETKLLEIDISELSDKELLEQIVKPIVKRLAQASFRSDVLTQLGMKVGLSGASVDYDIR